MRTNGVEFQSRTQPGTNLIVVLHFQNTWVCPQEIHHFETTLHQLISVNSNFLSDGSTQMDNTRVATVTTSRAWIASCLLSGLDVPKLNQSGVAKRCGLKEEHSRFKWEQEWELSGDVD
ncbi:hypothetical protein WICPIJ_006848 [Wickerhamomyces pijperi]|uniref:Uncharacterized protein n=1 Tax=Wickerhamomyces pijperi TaxID=599730 RepID=A0A9P8Q2Z7_WICPI|nr:hypothetical protein WICPIJ_006848 [Wickerhamomyces pijperi]